MNENEKKALTTAAMSRRLHGLVYGQSYDFWN